MPEVNDPSAGGEQPDDSRAEDHTAQAGEETPSPAPPCPEGLDEDGDGHFEPLASTRSRPLILVCSSVVVLALLLQCFVAAWVVVWPSDFLKRHVEYHAPNGRVTCTSEDVLEIAKIAADSDERQMVLRVRAVSISAGLLTGGVLIVIGWFVLYSVMPAEGAVKRSDTRRLAVPSLLVLLGGTIIASTLYSQPTQADGVRPEFPDFLELQASDEDRDALRRKVEESAESGGLQDGG
jgi:hypothetical protein